MGSDESGVVSLGYNPWSYLKRKLMGFLFLVSRLPCLMFCSETAHSFAIRAKRWNISQKSIWTFFFGFCVSVSRLRFSPLFM